MSKPLACPVCKKPAAPDFRPFCSPRCKQVDLGRWLTESYRVPTDEAPSDAPPPEAGDDKA